MHLDEGDRELIGEALSIAIADLAGTIELVLRFGPAATSAAQAAALRARRIRMSELRARLAHAH